MIFDFNVDLSAKTVSIKREFAAGLSLVWDAFTTPELLDQWWAPKPWMSRTKNMDFRVGGRRFYAMVSPEGLERWSVQEYTAIDPKSRFSFTSAFSDENGNRELPGSDWDLNFTEENGVTTLRMTIFNGSRERMEKMIEMGFREGFSATLINLDELLAEKKQMRRNS
jgi:uncharacterized protein YndB with AHSA1/START domain